MRQLPLARRVVFAASTGCMSMLLATATHSETAAAARLPSPQSTQIARSGPSDDLRVTVLGSGMGPRVDLQQFGARTLVEAGRLRLLFDCGRGATLRLAQVGVPIGTINRLFLTHLHSDHVIQIPDLLLTGWAGGGRTVPLEVSCSMTRE